jgi:hypothetical protein
MKLKVDVSDVPEDKRDAKFEEELLQFQCNLTLNTTSSRWLFRLALHEGAHLRYQRESGRECTLQGPHMEYKDGELRTFRGAVKFHLNGSIYDYEHQMTCMKIWLAGPLAVTTFTGELEDAEPDILAACKYLGIPRDKADSMILLTELDLWSDFRDPVIVGEILEAARDYARAVFHDDSCDGSANKMNGKACVSDSHLHGDYCVDWGIRKYRTILTNSSNNVSTAFSCKL